MEVLENKRREAIENVKRLRQYPSIALWCGNNENSEGWCHWTQKIQSLTQPVPLSMHTPKLFEEGIIATSNEEMITAVIKKLAD